MSFLSLIFPLFVSTFLFCSSQSFYLSPPHGTLSTILHHALALDSTPRPSVHTTISPPKLMVGRTTGGARAIANRRSSSTCSWPEQPHAARRRSSTTHPCRRSSTMRGWPEQPFPMAAGTSAADSILPTPTSSLYPSSAGVACAV